MKRKKIWYGILITVAVLVMAGYLYIHDYYHSVDVEKYMSGNDSVEVTKLEDGWFFDGEGTDKALIFYPGAKVEPTAYAPILCDLAEEGIDCFLVKMPANLAVFGVNKAKTIQENYAYDKWYMAGHSLGGTIAAIYCKDYPEAADGLIFLAAYPNKDVTAGKFAVLSVYGENDGVLNLDRVEEGRKLLPEDYEEVVIEGGNHAGFGSYGEQKRDGKATIPQKVQWKETVQIILDWMSAREENSQK